MAPLLQAGTAIPGPPHSPLPSDPRRPMKPLMSIRSAAIAALVIGAAVLISFNIPKATDSSSTQPLQFNHKRHVEGEKEPCDSCHVYYKTKTVAGRPELSACTKCHSEDPVSESPEEEKLIQFIKNNQDPPWTRRTRIPSHIRFSHQRHVMVGKVECQTCHGEIAKQTRPPSKPLVSIDMNFCLDCHRSRGVTIDDRSLKNLRESKLNRTFVEDMKNIRNRRFKTNAEVLAAAEKLSSTNLTEQDKQLIASNIFPSWTVTVDCIACHR